MEDTILKEAALKKALQEKEAERLDIEEKYSSLQEEAAGKTRYNRGSKSKHSNLKGVVKRGPCTCRAKRYVGTFTDSL